LRSKFRVDSNKNHGFRENELRLEIRYWNGYSQIPRGLMAARWVYTWLIFAILLAKASGVIS
jgi:hypothetical protein